METEDDNNQANITELLKVLIAAWFKSTEIVTWLVCKLSKLEGINNFCYKTHRIIFSKTLLNRVYLYVPHA